MSAGETFLYDAVRNCPLAAGLSQQQVEVLAGLVGSETFSAGEVLAREGTVDDRLVVVVDGTLDVVRHRGTPDETVLATLRAGDLAHELGFLDGTPHYATLVATSAAQVLMLERDAPRKPDRQRSARAVRGDARDPAQPPMRCRRACRCRPRS